MAKHTAVIFDSISGEITSQSFWSESIAIAQYDSIMRASASTVWIRTPRGTRWTVVGTMQSVLEDFRRAAEAPGTCAYIVSQDKVLHLHAHSPELIKDEASRVPRIFNHEKRIAEMTERAHGNIAKLAVTSRTWRSELAA